MGRVAISTRRMESRILHPIIAVMRQQQTWIPDEYDVNGRFVTSLGGAVLDLLAPKAGERILDLGCGDGVLTQQIAEAGAEVVGVDSSEAMVRAAQQRGLDARIADA